MFVCSSLIHLGRGCIKRLALEYLPYAASAFILNKMSLKINVRSIEWIVTA